MSAILHHISLLRLLPTSYFKMSTFQSNFLCSSSFKVPHDRLLCHTHVENKKKQVLQCGPFNDEIIIHILFCIAHLKMTGLYIYMIYNLEELLCGLVVRHLFFSCYQFYVFVFALKRVLSVGNLLKPRYLSLDLRKAAV